MNLKFVWNLLVYFIGWQIKKKNKNNIFSRLQSFKVVKFLFWGGFLGSKKTKLKIIEGIFTAKAYIEIITNGIEEFKEENGEIGDYLW